MEDPRISSRDNCATPLMSCASSVIIGVSVWVLLAFCTCCCRCDDGMSMSLIEFRLEFEIRTKTRTLNGTMRVTMVAIGL